MSKELSNKVVLVTGAGGATGRAAARLFASEVAQVAVSDFHEASELCRRARQGG